MLISVDFWKSMYGFAMDFRTRVFQLGNISEKKVAYGR